MSDSKKYWFKRRRYGWGYIPATWQGWLLVVVFIALAVGGALAFLPGSTPPETAFYFMFLAILVVALIRISIAKGPKPHWRWGKKPTDNPDEDF